MSPEHPLHLCNKASCAATQQSAQARLALKHQNTFCSAPDPLAPLTGALSTLPRCLLRMAQAELAMHTAKSITHV